jgi:hypothetical protein
MIIKNPESEQRFRNYLSVIRRLEFEIIYFLFRGLFRLFRLFRLFTLFSLLFRLFLLLADKFINIGLFDQGL